MCCAGIMNEHAADAIYGNPGSMADMFLCISESVVLSLDLVLALLDRCPMDGIICIMEPRFSFRYHVIAHHRTVKARLAWAGHESYQDLMQ
jgi:hypothetical protein